MSKESMLAGFRELIEAPSLGPGVAVRACLCGKMVSVVERTVTYHSGIVNFTECMCADCRKEFLPFVRVVCLGCKTLSMLLKPRREKTGFVFAPGTCVHIERCVSCSPGVVAAPVLEHLRFCRAQGRPTNVDADIVQEAEQKALQGVADADRMRFELQEAFPTS